MQIEVHHINNIEIAELLSDDILIATAEDGLDLLGNIYFQGYDRIIIHQKNITPDFFDLKTGIAGEILQKFSTYRVRLAIIGNFADTSSKSLNDFIRESNRTGHINFVASTEEGVKKFLVLSL